MAQTTAATIGNFRDWKGVDYEHAKWEFDNKMPSHIFFIVPFKTARSYNEATRFCLNAMERERHVNDLFLLEMDYGTGEIFKRVKTMDEMVHRRDEPFRRFVTFFTKKRGFKNKSITVNVSDKYRYLCIVMNHTFADGLRMYNEIMAAILVGASKETYSTSYVYRPVINEALMAKSVWNIMRLLRTTRPSFAHDARMKTVVHFVDIENKIITQTKNKLRVSFNFACMGFVLKYIMQHSDASSLNVSVSYGFKPNDRYYNNYTFVVISVKKHDNVEEMISKIAADIDRLKPDLVGNYDMAHYYRGLGEMLKSDTIDIAYASMLFNMERPCSGYIVNADPTMPVYIGVGNSRVNRRTNVAISIKTQNVRLPGNDARFPIVYECEHLRCSVALDAIRSTVAFKRWYDDVASPRIWTT